MRVIIVAGGAGARMKNTVPKQFMEIFGKPVLIHTLNIFAETVEKCVPIVVMCNSYLRMWQLLCDTHNFTLPHQIVEGGPTRFHSVKNGLNAISESEQGFVAIHDAVRPLVSRQTILNCLNGAIEHGCAIPTIDVVDSVRELTTGQATRALNRSSLRAVQTPQVFDVQLLKKAYKQEYTTEFTDCASVFESAGNTIYLTEGNIENIKITTPHDLKVAEALFNL